MSIKPETIGSDIEKDVDEVVVPAQLLHYDDARVIDLFHKIDKLEQADHDSAARMRGYVHHMCGNIDQALESIGLKKGEPADNAEQALHACAFLSNLGYASDAQLHYSTAAHPQTGKFTQALPLGLATGSFQTMHEFVALARKMNLSNLDRVPVDSLEDAARILRNAEIDDALLGKLMSIVGTVLREHGLMFHGSVGLEVFDVPDEATTVRLRYDVNASTSEALGLEMAFVDKLTEDNIFLPPEVTFSIQGIHA
ncbi:hypothetical protein [Ralstonia sp. UBA689]|uniref:hypothetical protein n=1 Tax=Ralstonia sp. UBA689 TaxID=1947373 RepID=UPI0025CBAE8E|nr:hypothetical protein [Ralstonia sp. UBA689]